MKKRPVMIVWFDSHAPDHQGWLDPEKVPFGDMKCKSVGYVLKETKKNITLAAHVAGKDCTSVDGVMTIPICAIVKRVKL